MPGSRHLAVGWHTQVDTAQPGGATAAQDKESWGVGGSQGGFQVWRAGGWGLQGGFQGSQRLLWVLSRSQQEGPGQCWVGGHVGGTKL